jgi:hypothetical protein
LLSKSIVNEVTAALINSEISDKVVASGSGLHSIFTAPRKIKFKRDMSGEPDGQVIGGSRIFSRVALLKLKHLVRVPVSVRLKASTMCGAGLEVTGPTDDVET